MSTETQFVVFTVALLVGGAVGACVVRLLGKARIEAAETAVQARLAEKDGLLTELRSAADCERRVAAEERSGATAKLDDLQRQLSEAREAQAKLIGAGESTQMLKEQLECKTEEVENYLQRLTKLSADVSSYKKAAEEAVSAKAEAIAAKDVATQRLIEAKDAACKGQLEDLRASCARQLADKEAFLVQQIDSLKVHCDAQLAEKETHIAEQRRLLAEAEKKMGETFDSLSIKALSTMGEEFLKTAKATLETTQAEAKGDVKLQQQAIEELLKPFAETMKSLDKRCQETDEKAASSQSLLKDQLDRLMGATDNLSSAFRKPNARGNWGEATLKNVFEHSGLIEGHDFELQHTTDAEDGKLRADAIVNLPKGRRLVIDAKNMWDGYQQAMTATDETARQLLLQKHAQAVRSQIKQLSSKAYWQQYDGLDCVVMFLPTEAMYHAAMEFDKDLLNDAIASRVYLASPMTLVGLLRAVQYVLDQERLNQNAVEISEIGKKLYEALRTYGTHYAKVGSSLERTVRAYNDSVGSLERNVLSKARQLRSKGVGAVAALPETQGIETLPSRFTSKELSDLSDGERLLEEGRGSIVEELAALEA